MRPEMEAIHRYLAVREMPTEIGIPVPVFVPALHKVSLLAPTRSLRA